MNIDPDDDTQSEPDRRTPQEKGLSEEPASQEEGCHDPDIDCEIGTPPSMQTMHRNNHGCGGGRGGG